MTDFLRPQARAALWRWRELLLGGGVAVFGLWWALGSFGIMVWVGWAIFLLGLMIIVTGIQRLRFSRGGGGAGVVEVKERRIAYLGPLTGGIVDLDDLQELVLDPAGRPAHWRLGTQSAILSIPVDAEGADTLFDAFAALPGIQTERMLEALNTTPKDPVVVWQAKSPERIRLN